MNEKHTILYSLDFNTMMERSFARALFIFGISQNYKMEKKHNLSSFVFLIEIKL